MKNGLAVVFGPVLDPAGIYGLGILAVNNELQVVNFIKSDPAAKITTIEYHPMMAVVPVDDQQTPV